jgi:hypothetical protein
LNFDTKVLNRKKQQRVSKDPRLSVRPCTTNSHISYDGEKDRKKNEKKKRLEARGKNSSCG